MSINEHELAKKIEAAIKNIPASNSSYISFRQETLSDILNDNLLTKIANIAASIDIKFE